MGYYKCTRKAADTVVLKHNLDSAGQPMDEIEIRRSQFTSSQVEEGDVYIVNLSFSKVSAESAAANAFPE